LQSRHVIFDVDGVLLASPHERAWREALAPYANPSRFTNAVYQAHVAGKPRVAGALAALESLGVADAASKAPAYADRKQHRLEDLIRIEGVRAYSDALRLVDALHAASIPMAVASSSKNANEMLRRVTLPSGIALSEVFGANVCGRDLEHGKPDPEIFLIAARELGIVAADCLVLEDAPAGIEAARAGGMAGLGVARFSDARSLHEAGADLVVKSLDEVSVDALRAGSLATIRSNK
jgi:HAD superfamily hydrolase (TIGR01509 family)